MQTTKNKRAIKPSSRLFNIYFHNSIVFICQEEVTFLKLKQSDHTIQTINLIAIRVNSFLKPVECFHHIDLQVRFSRCLHGHSFLLSIGINHGSDEFSSSSFFLLLKTSQMNK